MITIDGALNMIRALNDSSFECPHCGFVHDASDCDIGQHVISYHGDEDHDFICSECNKGFVVRETVRRSYETGRTSEEISE